MAGNLSIHYPCFILFLIFIAIGGAVADFIKVDFTRDLNVDNLTSKTYTAFLKELRKKLADTYSGKQKVPVLQVYNKLKPKGFDVNLKSGRTTVPVRFRRDSLYVVGYQIQTPKKMWYEFTEKDEKGKVLPPLIKDSKFLDFDGGYTTLERIAGSVVNMEINKKKLNASVWDLASSQNTKERAQALLVVIQMISEAARFADVSNHFSTNLDKNAKLPQWMRDLENQWSAYSYMVLKSETDPCYKFPRPTVNGKVAQTVDDLRNYFTAMYRDPDTLLPPCKKVDLHQEF